MTIDATDVRDLINNPEGRTPYPENPRATSTEDQIRDILLRLNALENASGGGTYTGGSGITISEENVISRDPIVSSYSDGVITIDNTEVEIPAGDYNLNFKNVDNNDYELKLLDKGNNAKGDTIEFTGVFSSMGDDDEHYHTVVIPRPVSFYIDNTNINKVPKFNSTPSSSILKSSGYGYNTGAWQIEWKKTKIPFGNWVSDTRNDVHKGNYNEHNSVVLSANIAESADESTHQLDAYRFFYSVFREFLMFLLDPAGDNNARNIIKFAIIDSGGNFNTLSSDVKNKYTRQIVINNYLNHGNSYFTDDFFNTLSSDLGGALGGYSIYIEWDKRVVKNSNNYDKLS